MSIKSKNNARAGRFILLAALMLIMLSSIAYSDTSGGLSLRVDISSTFTEVTPGRFILATIDVYSYQSSERMDISFTYSITDTKGYVFFTKKNTMAIETHISDIEKIDIPSNFAPGKYVLEVQAEAPGQEPVKSSESFIVIESSFEDDFRPVDYTFYLISLTSLLVVFAIYLIYKLISLDEQRRQHGK